MSHLLLKRFHGLFPGPYDIRPNRDSVDNTYDIYCLATEGFIAATYYWENRKNAFDTAIAITTALNLIAQYDLPQPEHWSILNDLIRRCPPPYEFRRDTCELRGGFWEVYSPATGSGLIELYGSACDLNTLGGIYAIRTALTYCAFSAPLIPVEQPDHEVEEIYF